VSVTVGYGRTIPTKPYGGDRVDVGMTANIAPDEDAEWIAAELVRRCRDIVDKAEAAALGDYPDLE